MEMRPWIDGIAIDKEVAEKTPCEKCGAPMEFRPEFERGEEDETPRYRAFAVCMNPECGNEIEF